MRQKKEFWASFVKRFSLFRYLFVYNFLLLNDHKAELFVVTSTVHSVAFDARVEFNGTEKGQTKEWISIELPFNFFFSLLSLLHLN